MDEVIVGVDLGGTAVKLGVADREGHLLESCSIPTEAHRGADSVIQRIIEQISILLEQCELPLGGLGIGVPGLVDIKTGVTRFLPNLPTHWVDVPLGQRLYEEFHCPVQVANDARTAALGELKFGYGQNREDLTFAFFTLGTGVGGGVAIDGRLRLGEVGAAGELGHQTIDPHGVPCGCGNRGCLETLASGPSILASTIRLMMSGQAPRLHEYCEGQVAKVSIQSVVAVLESEESVREVVVEAGRAIGVAAANVVTTIHPDMIILGGGVAEIGSLLTETVKDEINRRVRMFPTDNIEVKKSKLGVQAGILGCIGLGLLAQEKSPV